MIEKIFDTFSKSTSFFYIVFKCYLNKVLKTDRNIRFIKQFYKKHSISLMIITNHPFRYNYKSEFPELNEIATFEGGVIYKATKDNKH